MSVLSQFLQKPYSGLSQSGSDLLFAATGARFLLESTDNTISGANLPEFVLKNNYQANDAGGIINWQALNSAGSFKTAASIRAALADYTDLAEHGKLELSVLVAGATRNLSLRGDTAAFAPSVSGAFSLGSSSLRFGGLYIGDASPRSGDFLPDSGNNGITIGSTTTHPLYFKTNGVVRGSFSATGGFGVPSPFSNTLIAAGGVHFSANTSSYGFLAQFTVPATTTVAAYGYASYVTTATASFSLSGVYSFYAGDPIKGAGSTITSAIGFFAADQTTGTNNYGFWSSVTAGANKWSLYGNGTADSFLRGGLQIKPGGSGSSSALLDVDSNSAVQSAAQFLSSNGTPSADTVIIAGPVASTYNLLKIGIGTERFQVRGDGVVFFGDTTTQLNGAAIVATGRADFAINQTHDLVGSTLAATLTFNNTITVPDAKTSHIIYLSPSVTLSGTTSVLSGLYSAPAVSASGAGTVVHGAYLAPSLSGSGNLRGATILAISNASATGSFYGAHIGVIGVATNAAAYAVRLDAAGPATAHAFLVSSTNSNVGYGVLIDNTSSIQTFAFQYTQRTAATGGFLNYVDSGGATRFKVDVNGSITMNALAQRFYINSNDATHANRFAFQEQAGGSGTAVSVLPNIAAGNAVLRCYGGSDADNTHRFGMQSVAGSVGLMMAQSGSGTLQDINLMMGNSNTICFSLKTNNDITLGPAGAVTGMTAGFPYMPATAGVPSGTPTARSGFVPFLYDSTNNKLYAYSSGWKSVTLA